MDGAQARRVAAMFGADPEVGRDLEAVDWTATPLGPPGLWPQSLQTAVSILLSSRFAMWMAWGPDLTFFCNAAYRRDTLGRKYPWALGRSAREVWAEIWDDISARIDSVVHGGVATWDTDLGLFLERSGYPEETFHTFSYSPLRDGEDVAGMLCVVSETTDRVIGDRRMSTLRELGAERGVQPSEARMLAVAAERLGANPRDLPFTLTYLFDDVGAPRLAAASGFGGREPAISPVHWPVEVARDGHTELVGIAPGLADALPGGAWAGPPSNALVVPLTQKGSPPYGFLVAGLNPHRPLDDGYRGFLDLVATHLAADVGNARSYAAQQRRAEDLAELDRAKTAFFSNVSHEFRTPLTLILGPVAELLGRAEEIGPAAAEELEVVRRNGFRLTKLVNTLLDFSRIEAGRMQATYQPVNLSSVTAELASVFRSAMERAGLRLTVDCPPLDEPVYLDRDMWEKVVLNLLSNALKFTLDGSVSVSVRRESGEAVVVVSDTGIGVAEAEIPRLFERFHRIESARSRSHEGSGIGLALVRELVTLNGGTIDAASIEGAGTSFTVRLPFGSAHLDPAVVVSAGAIRTAAQAAQPYLQEALDWLPETEPVGADGVRGDAGDRLADGAGFVEPPALTGPPARILVADDNADMRDYLARLLRAAGYGVDVVEDGRAALDAIRLELPDLVVSDVMMPRLDGLALVSALRGDPRTSGVPVLLLSARAGQESAIEGLESGADDYLVKPFAAADLLARVRANVELARLRGRHTRWRAAVIDSLQEAFFLCDDTGAVIEINSAFTDILGFDAAGLPYEPELPWWPDQVDDPAAYALVDDAFSGLLTRRHGSYTVPVDHRDGHRLWITFTFSHATDPDTGRSMVVGTLRDVTAEHYAVARSTALAALNELLAGADTVDEVLRGTATHIRTAWQARQVLAISFLDGAETPTAVGDPAPPDGWRADLAPDAWRLVESLRVADLLMADVSEPGWVGIALRHPRGVVVLLVELSQARTVSMEDQTLMAVLAGRLGQGLQRVEQLDEQRETALVLQHAMLGPGRLPSGFAVRYQPATRPLQIGGDWYDLVDLDDGCIALVVGDCVGHGLAAATVMGQLRSAVRALLLENPSPSAALAGLDRFAARLPGAACTTAFCGVLNPHTGDLDYSSAGHPPAIVTHADGSTRLLEGAQDVPLGLAANRGPDHVRPQARDRIPPRATLLLYTDGLVERRRVSLDDGIARAADLIRGDGGAPLEELASRVMSTLVPAEGYQDDVALLLYRQPAPLELDFPADVNELAATRTALRGWLTRADVAPDQMQDILIAAGEAVANSIEHGHRDSPGGLISLRATAFADWLRLTVADTGVWRTPRPGVDPTRGRGVLLMRGLVDDVAIHPSETGTTVHLEARIG